MKTSVSLKPSRWPARLDLAQSFSGLFLAIFMWLHMFFVSSILLGKDTFWVVARAFEGYFILDNPIPQIVSLAVAGVYTIIIFHAILAMRKVPANWRQYRAFWTHMRGMHHSDTTLWFIQVVTGFAMFFLASVHLYLMLTQPDHIGPFGSADRMWSGRMWPLYLLLLFSVEIHGGVGMYRLALKWGWFAGGEPARARRRLSWLKWLMTAFFLILGLASLAAYIKIGIEHEADAGTLYTPAWVKEQP